MSNIDAIKGRSSKSVLSELVGRSAPASAESIERVNQRMISQAQQNAVKTASRYQAMTLHERKLQEQEQENISKKLYGESFTPKNFKGRVQKYFEGNNITYEEVKDDKKYFDSYAQLISNTDPANRSKQDEILLKLLSDLSVSAQDIINKTDTAKEKMDSSWKSVEVADGIELSWPERLAQYVMFGDPTVFEDAAGDDRDEYAASANEYYSLAIGDVEKRKQRIEELQAQKSAIRRGETDARHSAKEIKKQVELIDEEIRNIKASINGYTNASEYISSQVGHGVSNLFTSLSATGEILFMNPIKSVINLCGGDSSFLDGKPARDALNSVFEERALKSSYAIGDKYNIGGTLINTVIQNIPNIFMAGLGLYDDVLNGISQIASNGNKIGTYLKSLAKNPMFWTSFSQTFGNEYEQSVDAGENPTIAMTYALLSSSINAAIEIGGGIETLPRELRNIGTDEKKLLKWVISSLEEGGEEILQNTVSKILGYIAFDRSTITREELYNFSKDTLNQGAMGIVGGFVIGGGQVTFENIVNAKSNREYSNIGQSVIDTDYFEDIVKYAKNSDNLSIRNYANNINPNDINAYQAGVIYSYVCKDINTMISTATNIESLNVAYEAAVKTAGVDNSIIIGIITPRYIEKAALLGLDNTAIIEGILNANKKVSSYNHSSTEKNSNTTESSNLQDSVNNDIIISESAENHTLKYSPEQHQAAVLRYKSSESYHINAALRENETLSEQEQEFVDTLDEALLQLPTYEGTVYRNLTFDDLGGEEAYNEFLEQYFPDKIVFYEQFISCSKNQDGYPVEGQFKVQLIIDSKNARDVEGFGNNMESEVIYPLNSVFIVNSIALDGEYPIIYLQEVTENGYNSTEKQGDAVRNLQEPYTENGDLQGVPERDTNGNNIGTIRPQQAPSAGQRDFVRTRGKSKTVLPTESDKQVETQATSNEEVASFMPENEQSEDFESGEENNTPETQTPASEEFEEDFEEEDITLDEPDIHNAKVQWVDDFVDGIMGYKRKSEGQEFLFKAAKKLGWKIGFGELFVKDKKGNIILDESGKPKRANSKVVKGKKEIIFDYECENPIKELIFHELTHFLETNITAYQDFANAVMHSKVFKEWVHSNGYPTIKDFNKRIQQDYAGTRGFEKVGSEKAEGSANLELVAKFVAEKLFADKQQAALERLVNELNPKHRPTLREVIAHIFERLKTAFFGTAQQKQFAMLEERWLKTYKKAEAAWQSQQKSQAQKNTAQDGDVEYSINQNFYNQLNNWDGNTIGFSFVIGETSDALEMAGVPQKQIRWDASKIKTLLNKHTGMTIDTIRQIPNLLEAPIVIIDSKQNSNARLVMGDLYDKNGKIVTVVLLLTPTSKKGNQLDIIKISSAQGRGHIESLFKNSDGTDVKIRYVDKKRIGNWLKVNGLQLPLLNLSDSNNSITDKQSPVNNNITQTDEQYSIATKNDMADILERVERGEMSAKEAYAALSRSKVQTPYEIAYTTEEDANTTPPLSRKTGEATGNKESKTYESLLDSDIFDDDFKAEVKTDDFIRKYQSVTNKETLRKAANELDEGGIEYVKRWWALSPERANLIDTAVGFILMDRYQRIGNYESAIAVAEKIREFGTASGQQVQIFSILGRLDANSMVIYAQRELENAYESMVEKRSKRWISKNAERFNLTEDDIEFIRIHTIQAAQLPEGRDKAIRLAEIATLLQDKLPPERGQGFRALQRISMLLNGKTNIRNITGNGIMVPVFITSDFFGAVVDKAVSKKTGVRTTGVFDVKSVKGFKKGVFETMDDFRRHINTRNEELNRYDVGSGKSFNENHKGKLAKQLNDCAKVLNALDRFTSFCLEMGDRPFYEMWYINSLNNQMRLNKVDEATPEMIAIASLEALQRTWQDTNKVTMAVKNAKAALNVISINGYGLGDVMVKFVKTPANLTKAIVDFSPAGLVKAIAADGVTLENALQTGQFEPQLQKNFVNSLSKGITGTLLYVLAVALATKGLIRGKDDEDKDTSNFEKYIQGQPEYSIKLFGKWYSYEWMQPIGAILATVSDYMENKKRNPDNEWYENILEAIKAGGEVLYNQSFMQSIQMLFTSDNVIDGIVDGILSEPSVFVPQIFSQFANATDEYRRVTFEYNKPFETALNKVKVKIPWLRKTLEKQVDVLGRDVPNSQKGIFNAFFNPGNTYTDTSNEVSDEVYKIYTATGDKTVIPRKAPYYVTVKGIKRSFTAKETADFQRVTGKISSDIINDALDSKNYENLSDAQKAEFISNVYSYATAKAKSSFVYSYDILAAIEGENIITEKWYAKASDKAKKEIAREYFMSNYKVAERIDKNDGSVAEYFIAKAMQ